MTADKQELVLEDFKTIDLPDGSYYLSCTIGDYEITLEPHMITGYCVGIYQKKSDWLALEKRAVWLRNHPASQPPADIPEKIIIRALSYANQLYKDHLMHQKYEPRTEQQ